MKRYFVKLKYTVQAEVCFDIDEHQLKGALGENRFGNLEGAEWQKAEKLFTQAGEDIANEISQSTWDYQPIELGDMNFTLRQEYRTEQAAENDTDDDPMDTEVDPYEVFLRLGRVAWLDDVQVDEHDSLR